MSDPSPIVEMVGISVDFPGQRALDGVDLTLRGGEVHALMGENGAGKSTLIKVLTGAVRADRGEIRLDGRPVEFAGPADAQRSGVVAVYQEVNLLPNLTVAENVLLGREPRGVLGISRRRMHEEARAALAILGVEVDPGSALASHSLATRQLIAIARAMSQDARVLVLDEPTSSLDRDEVTELFTVVERLRSAGVAIVFISHFLEQVFEISTRITVLRNGRRVGEYLTPELLRVELVQHMIGRDIASLDELSVRRDHRVEPAVADDAPEAEVAVAARGLVGNGVGPADFTIREGEVLGLAGLLGSGRSELARTLGGVDPLQRGELVIGGRPRRLRGPRSAIRARVVYVSEDRKREGIVADLTVRENIALALQAQRGWLRPMSRRQTTELAASYIEALRIRPADPEAKVGDLSGGNQQKVLLARWLALAPRVLVLDEPTRGIDVAAKLEIQRLVAQVAENGMSLVYISAELDEVMRLSDQIAILRDRHVVAVVDRGELTGARLLAVISDGGDDDPPAVP